MILCEYLLILCLSSSRGCACGFELEPGALLTRALDESRATCCRPALLVDASGERRSIDMVLVGCVDGRGASPGRGAGGLALVDSPDFLWVRAEVGGSNWRRSGWRGESYLL